MRAAAARLLDGRAGCVWLLGGGVLGGLVLVAALFIWPLLVSGEPAAPEPVLTVIPFPTDTPTPLPTATLPPTAVPTATSTPPPVVGEFAPGQLVQIQGTQGDGLRLRSSPGLDSDVRFLALESEVFEVQEGPVQADDYIWWFLVNPYDNSKRGWGVANYMRATEGG
jgi:hypothetical protein